MSNYSNFGPLEYVPMQTKRMIEPAIYTFASGQGTTVEQVICFGFQNVDETGQLNIWDWKSESRWSG